jgi:hypothetical protein
MFKGYKIRKPRWGIIFIDMAGNKKIEYMLNDINGKPLKIGDEVYYARMRNGSVTLVRTHITNIKGFRVSMGRYSCHGGDQLAKVR